MPTVGETCSPAKVPRLEDAEMKEIVKPEIRSLQQPTLRFAKLSENAYTPTRGSKQAAGFDLYRYRN